MLKTEQDKKDHSISVTLANSLGWKTKTVVFGTRGGALHTWCEVEDPSEFGFRSKHFDYRDPSVALGLIKWLGSKGVCVELGAGGSTWYAHKPFNLTEGPLCSSDSLELTVAQATIRMRKK